MPIGYNPVIQKLVQKPATEETSAKAKKNARKKENAKKKKLEAQAAAEAAATLNSVTESLKKTSVSGQSNSSPKPPQEGSSGGGDAAPADLEKRLKNLKKKLRQVEALQAKIDSGELKDPSKEQLEKLQRRAALEEEIEDVELDMII